MDVAHSFSDAAPVFRATSLDLVSEPVPNDPAQTRSEQGRDVDAWVAAVEKDAAVEASGASD